MKKVSIPHTERTKGEPRDDVSIFFVSCVKECVGGN
jgi:hypothetical protein